MGTGLLSGKPIKVHLLPAKAGEGIVFNERLKASFPYARVIDHRTCLVHGKERIDMVEHFLAACYGCGITDLKVQVDGQEMPFGDGSALPFVRIIKRAGQRPALSVAERKSLGAIHKLPLLRIRSPVLVTQGRSFIIALPTLHQLRKAEDPLRVHCILELSGLGKQFFSFSGSRMDFEENVAPARTFGKVSSAVRCQLTAGARTLGFSISSQHGWLFPKRWRFNNEPCRHKVLDLLGDISLLSFPIKGEIFAYKPGHKLNLLMVKRLNQICLERSQKEAR